MNVAILVLVGGGMMLLLFGITYLSKANNLNGIKSKTVGDGQYGTARWATKTEIKNMYKHIKFTPDKWRDEAKHGKNPTDQNGNPLPQGIVVGCDGDMALVDTGDVHVLMIGAAGVGKTAYWLYPCLEFALSSGISIAATDTNVYNK